MIFIVTHKLSKINQKRIGSTLLVCRKLLKVRLYMTPYMLTFKKTYISTFITTSKSKFFIAHKLYI